MVSGLRRPQRAQQETREGREDVGEDHAAGAVELFSFGDQDEQCPGVHGDVHEPAMQKTGCNQSPVLASINVGCKFRSQGDQSWQLQVLW